jgi:CheY-like chemotaxis protein
MNAQEAEEDWVAPSTDAPPVRVLFVDDDEICRRSYEEIAALFGYSVRLAASGREALAIALRSRGASGANGASRARRIDVIVLEVALPDVNGLDVVRRLRESPETARIPIIALTYDRSEAMVEALQGRGCTEILFKPIKVEELSGAIHLFRRFISPSSPRRDAPSREGASALGRARGRRGR